MIYILLQAGVNISPNNSPPPTLTGGNYIISFAQIFPLFVQYCTPPPSPRFCSFYHNFSNSKFLCCGCYCSITCNANIAELGHSWSLLITYGQGYIFSIFPYLKLKKNMKKGIRKKGEKEGEINIRGRSNFKTKSYT